MATPDLICDPLLDEDAPSHWPPVIHIARQPVRAGDKALCGARLMGEDYGPADGKATCKRCSELFERLRR